MLACLGAAAACSGKPEAPYGQQIDFTHCSPEVSYASGYQSDKRAGAFWRLEPHKAVATTEDPDIVRTALRCSVKLPAPAKEVKVFFEGARASTTQGVAAGFGAGALIFTRPTTVETRFSDTAGGEPLDLTEKPDDPSAQEDPVGSRSARMYAPGVQTIVTEQPISTIDVVVWLEEPWNSASARATFNSIWVATGPAPRS